MRVNRPGIPRRRGADPAVTRATLRTARIPLVHAAVYLLSYGVLLGGLTWRGDVLRAHPSTAYLALLANLVPTVVLLRWMTRSQRPVNEALAGLAANTAGLIAFFAAVYTQIGLAAHPGPIAAKTGLYFSIVTWTTLGYGDLQPTEVLRLFAGGEALIGYLYLSLLVAVLAKALKL